MKRTLGILMLLSLLIGCESDDNNDNRNDASVSFNFTHNWDGELVLSSDFNSIQYTNSNGEQISIERLRYLLSDFKFINDDGQVLETDEYVLVDLTNDQGLAYTPSIQLPQGTYTSVSFTFGLDNEDNIDGAYQDLNSASFNVPMMLGGGYHYMQFDGKYIDDTDTEAGFNYHAIRAVDNPGDNPTFPQDTYFEVDLGAMTITDNTVVEVQMNIAEWFKNPHTWNLNELDTVLMPNSTAQIMMYDNGQSVFSLGSISTITE